MTFNKIFFGLELEDIKIIHNILAYYPTVLNVRIFGSRAKANNTKLSDVDLVIVGDGQDRISSILSAIRESDFLLSVDIIGYDSTLDNELLKSEIDNYSKLFWERDETIINQKVLNQAKQDIFWSTWNNEVLINDEYNKWIKKHFANHST